VVADAQSLPFDNESFDVVTCNHTLYHVPDKDRALTEFVRVLRTRGRFAGIYNTPAHLAELWDAVGADWARAGSRAHRAIQTTDETSTPKHDLLHGLRDALDPSGGRAAIASGRPEPAL